MSVSLIVFRIKWSSVMDHYSVLKLAEVITKTSALDPNNTYTHIYTHVLCKSACSEPALVYHMK